MGKFHFIKSSFLYLILFGLLSIFFSCSSHHTKEIFSIPKEKLFRQQWKYYNKYGRIIEAVDTTVMKHDLCLVYKKGSLKQAGKTKQERRYGYWFVFRDSLFVDYIYYYRNTGTDTIFHPFAIINQRW